MKTWVDGQLVLEETNMLWRKYDNVTISSLFISTFFGGSDDTWASPQDQVPPTCHPMIVQPRNSARPAPPWSNNNDEPRWSGCCAMVSTVYCNVGCMYSSFHRRCEHLQQYCCNYTLQLPVITAHQPETKKGILDMIG